MAETAFGVRGYTLSEKTKRPPKSKQDIVKIEKRNTNQKRLYITLDNIDEMFSSQDKYPICYEFIFNLIQGKVTKYFSTRSYDKKKELSMDSINRLYSVLKRKLLRIQEETGKPPVLFFYLSQFYRYIELVVYSTVFYGTQDLKFIVQEPEDFNTDDVLQNEQKDLFPYELDDSFSSDLLCTGFSNKLNDDVIQDIELSNTIADREMTIEDELEEYRNSNNIKHCIELNQKLDAREKRVLLKIYKNVYSIYGHNSLTKRDQEILDSIQKRIKDDPELLNDLKEILNA